MSRTYCIKCKKKHEGYSWRNRGQGWFCDDSMKYPEFTTEKIKEERKKYLKSQIQSHRQGIMSKEFIKFYPDKVKGMLKEGAITRKEVREARNVWKDLPNYDHIDKTQ
jgi:hypothetical protein